MKYSLNRLKQFHKNHIELVKAGLNFELLPIR